MQKVVTTPSEFSEIRGGLVATDGGFAITTTAQCIDIPFGTDWMSLTARNFVNCATVKFAINPYLTIIATTNALTTPVKVGGVTVISEETRDLSAELQDGDITDVQIDSFPTATNGGYFYIGAPIPFRGCYIDVGTDPNATSNDLTCYYWNDGWVDLSDTDATDTGASLAVDGTVTWTVPSAWKKDSLVNAGATTLKETYSISKQYWTRWEWSAAMEAGADIMQIQALNRSTNYAQLIEGQAFEQRIHTKSSGISVGNVEALTNAGTANLIINAASESWGGATPREVME